MIDAEKLAKLARIKLSLSEKEKIQNEFEAILGYISKLNEVDLSKIDKDELSDSGEVGVLNAINGRNVLRNDIAEKFFANREKLLNGSGLRSGDHIKVKHVFE